MSHTLLFSVIVALSLSLSLSLYQKTSLSVSIYVLVFSDIQEIILNPIQSVNNAIDEVSGLLYKVQGTYVSNRNPETM